ncbi:MAG: hypothetical protein A2033_15485 [Bacteroidetes bacterium GWA2_31_9]|nr:MAG: hypothetical protein A2033_15485 [Bacteroidetes bacterium GWA2_31_9]
MKLLFLRSFSKHDNEFLLSELSNLYDIIIPDDFSNKSLLELVKNVDVCLGLNINKELIENAQFLKLIQIPGAGVNMIDFNIFKGKKIKVCNSHSNAKYVAEYGVALLFALIKKIHIHDNFLRNGSWFKPKNDDSDLLFLNDTLINKKIGIIGFGHIGQNIAKFLQPYEVDFLVLDKKAKSTNLNIYNGTFNIENLNNLLKKSDIIFTTIPLTEETRNLLDIEKFKIMKRDAYLINISRSEVVNKKALFNSLKNNIIRGAAIDVWYNDSVEKNGLKFPSDEFPFHELNNILLSPYRAGYVMNYSPHLYDVVKNLKLFALTNTVINEIDINLGY